MEITVFLSLFLLFSGAFAACDRCVYQSKTAYTPFSAVATGACGYGAVALDYNHGFVAAGSSPLYRDGVGCGSCYQVSGAAVQKAEQRKIAKYESRCEERNLLFMPFVLETTGGFGTRTEPLLRRLAVALADIERSEVSIIRCHDPNLCSRGGIKVVLTDLNHSNKTAFRLSIPAFLAMAHEGMEQELVRHDMVDIEYKRIPCEYKGRSLSVKVDESSKNPSYLAIEFLYLGGQTDILEVVVVPDRSEWELPDLWSMSRISGAVWAMSQPPFGPLKLKITVMNGDEKKYVMSQLDVLPTDWTAGEIYKLGFQITSIAYEKCSPTCPCDHEDWK